MHGVCFSPRVFNNAMEHENTHSGVCHCMHEQWNEDSIHYILQVKKGSLYNKHACNHHYFIHK